jgi:hypothetical protein
MPISLGLDSWALVMSAESGIWFDAIARSAEVFRLWQCRSRGGACSVLAFEESSPLFGHKGTLPYSDYLVAFFLYGAISSSVVGKLRFPSYPTGRLPGV